MTRFTHDEQYTLMTLWCIFRSPLIFGGDLRKMDDFTLSLITNDEVLAVDQHSSGNRQLFNVNGQMAWVADVPGSTDKYVGLFNLQDKGNSAESGAPVTLKLAARAGCAHLWRKEDIGTKTDQFSPMIPWHGAGLYRISTQ